MTAPPAANGERGRSTYYSPLGASASVRPPFTIVIGHVPCRTRLRLSPPLARQSAASLLLHPSSRERQGFRTDSFLEEAVDGAHNAILH